MNTKLDAIVIGAGSAGLAAVKQISKQTDNFLLINEGPYGTTCARVGCMPSKVLIEAANAFHARHKAEAFGIRGHQNLTIDLPAVMQRVRNLRDRFVKGVLKSTEGLGERSISGRAILLDHQTVKVGSNTFKAKRIILATGSTPIMPKPWMQLGDKILTTDNFFEQKDLPKRMAIIGLGPIGVEIAQALSRLGIDVHAFGKTDQIAGVSDPEIAKTLRTSLESEFSIYTSHEVELTGTAEGVRVEAGPVSIEVDKVLAAVGRKPNVDNLGLDRLGVSLDSRGMPSFDRHTMQIENLPIFIAGDANADVSLLHEAADEGYIAGLNATADDVTCFQRRTPLAVVFSDPGIAAVGVRYSELDQPASLIGSINFATQGRALSAQRNNGLMRIYARQSDGLLLGAEMCCPAAEHMSHLLALAIGRHLTVQDLLGMPFYHPVLEEGLRSALRDIAGQLNGSQRDLVTCSNYEAEALN
ncbi:dihydrolipoyl dehydrogenase [Nitrincola sp. A-D6]|uniref:dihydrolipoyl dehydrogenase n=1 Tax=Nitrincola sp. A-D6 TaxID=1545442 RepID=UPI0009DCAB4E|nr:dihydrolipoyl dehydrogenase [Nitrincola sp. A-D6]